MPNKRFSDEQRLEILQKYKKYPGSLTGFCKIKKISKATLYKWIKNTDENNNSKFINLKYIPQKSVQNIDAHELASIAKITSPIKISINKLSIDFASGCKLEELKAVLEVINVA